MRATLFSAAAAFALAVAAFSGSAQAQCVWNGYNWSCPQLPGNYTYHQPSWGGYGYPAAPEYYPYYGYKPYWLPSYPGPRPSSGAGH